METTKTPYEVLFRFDEAAGLSGAHVVWRLVTRDAGKIVAEALLPAEPIAVGSQTGFPLDDILSLTMDAALIQADEAVANRETALALRDEADAARVAALAERDAAVADAALARRKMNAAHAVKKAALEKLKVALAKLDEAGPKVA